MKELLTAVIIAASLGEVGSTFVRPSNTAASTRRGLKEYEAKDYREASEAFALAQKIRPSGTTSYNLGTALAADGKTAAAAKAFDVAAQDPQVGASALYNRGNLHLSQQDYERAINDYVAALRREPSNAAAKRNLEIALRRRNEQQQRQQGSDPGQQDGQEQPSPSTAEPPESGDQQADALLRSIEQQEREELSRMRRAGGRRKVGW